MTGERKPNLQLVFTEGTYEHALQCFEEAKRWVVDSGLCFKQGLVGEIISPRFHDETPPSIMTGEWIERTGLPGWRTAIAFWLDRPEMLPELQATPLPNLPAAWQETEVSDL